MSNPCKSFGYKVQSATTCLDDTRKIGRVLESTTIQERDSGPPTHCAMPYPSGMRVEHTQLHSTDHSARRPDSPYQ